jgi:DNA polymerase-3 subunit beta
MIVTCTYEKFKEALLFIEPAINKNANLSILQNVLIEAKENNLHFSATNLEIGVIKKIPAKIVEGGTIAIPINLILNFLTALRGEEHIKMELEDNQLILKSGIHITKINGFKADDFPIIPQSEKRDFSNFKLEKLREIINKTLPFISNLETRPELMGVLFKQDDGKIYTVATDSFRLGENIINIEELIINKEFSLNENGFIILPKQLCIFINKINDVYKNINCSIENNHFFIESDDLNITAKLIDGNYPDYKQIIPLKFLTTLIIDKEELVEALRIATVFTNKDDKEIFLVIEDNKLKISTKQQEIGGSTTEIDIEIEGDNQDIAINPHFILEGIRKIKEEKISININNGMTPVILRGIQNDKVNKNFTYLVMPVKSSSK